uniref:INTRON-ENCODED ENDONUCLEASE I-SCEI n=1 Tax=Podoviridae sp. ct8Lf7 TaxID=2827723 RepID=A0A8S5S0F8_9CAUD|nr:MAG TPA: INTRON-ENCODED ENDONUCLEASE I-SCEI [Podoviridae sp. ct8Lf7]
MIEPFVPDCMAYKLIVPKFYLQECTASHLDKIKGMKIYSEQ